MEDELVDLLNGVWAADEYNKICSLELIELPATEDEITTSIIDGTGQNIVEILANTEVWEGMSLRSHAKAVTSSYLENGCKSEPAIKKRLEIINDLSNYSKILEQL